MEEQDNRKSKGGRPAKKIKRDSHLMVRLTNAERFLIESKAKEAGLKPSEWFRQSAKRAKVVPRFRPEDAGFRRELAGMANNLNQLTKKAHQQGLLILSGQCRDLLSLIHQLIKKYFDDREDT